MRAFLMTLCLVTTLTACSGQKGFHVKNLAKTDMDMVSDIHVTRVRELAEVLTVKLYKRNPRELLKSPDMTVENRLSALMNIDRKVGFEELGGADGSDALILAFTDGFQGDRVFALMAGITGMLNKTYQNRDEFFIPDSIDEQKLYDSARNLEIVAWMLNTKKNKRGQPMIMSNGYTEDGTPNLSYERVLSQMIVIQDMMATMVSDSTNRSINKVVHSVASLTFFPI
ncbi:hypothetical protein CS022_18600 [Veronia nyctiphanis]|uniref:Lipoprotein n=1 Tax=Veronia nyctiphanis TaxID=1278244 RepID=A0A4Q0YMD6_9GAMM|nr:hypothetical protein [Veronia nyctiphanis]RXJ72007.1 hypothetical protein CS022_18600 [Veronia nyctiphanis]